jgi:hypothetical protein
VKNLKNNIENEDKLIKWLIQNEFIKTPSEAFVTDIMNKIEKIPVHQHNAFINKPLIPLKLWLIAGSALAMLFGIALLKLNPDTRLTAMQDNISNFISGYFPLISSKIFVLSTVFFIVFFIIQTLIISYRIHRMDFNKS